MQAILSFLSGNAVVQTWQRLWFAVKAALVLGAVVFGISEITQQSNHALFSYSKSAGEGAQGEALTADQVREIFLSFIAHTVEARLYQEIGVNGFEFAEGLDDIDGFDNDAAQVSARTAQESAAARESALLRTSREAGNTGLLSVLDAQRRERLAALERTRATARQLLDTVTLFVALGGADPAANSDTVAGAAAGG